MLKNGVGFWQGEMEKKRRLFSRKKEMNNVARKWVGLG